MKKMVSYRLPEGLVVEVGDLAAEQGRTVTEIVTVLLQRGMAPLRQRWKNHRARNADLAEAWLAGAHDIEEGRRTGS
jgi:hypothetical protein